MSEDKPPTVLALLPETSGRLGNRSIHASSMHMFRNSRAEPPPTAHVSKNRSDARSELSPDVFLALPAEPCVCFEY